MTVTSLEEALGKVVKCHDGNERRVVAVSEKHVTYEVLCGDSRHSWWMELSPTRRSAIEADFIGAECL